MRRRNGNKANSDRNRIIADIKELLLIYEPAIERIPKVSRITGAVREMQQACYDMIDHFSTAWSCKEVRDVNIQRMFGDFGRLCVCFEIVDRRGFLTVNTEYRIAQRMDKIEEGLRRWYNALSHSVSGVEQGPPRTSFVDEYAPSETNV